MEHLIIYLVLFAVVANTGALVLWSVIGGLKLLKHSYARYTANRRARRILAWNLIETGLTAVNIGLILFFWDNLSASAVKNLGLAPTGMAFPIIATIAAVSIMVVLYIFMPLKTLHSGDQSIRWATRKTVQIGLPKLLIIIVILWTRGIGLVIAIPYIFWSVKQIRRWNGWLENQPDHRTSAVEGSNAGMLIVPSAQPMSKSNFKITLPNEDQ